MDVPATPSGSRASHEAASASSPEASIRNAKKRLKKQFFMVFSPEGETAPTVVHPTHKAAMWTAVRMAKQFPDQKFFVMGSLSFPITAEAAAEREQVQA